MKIDIVDFTRDRYKGLLPDQLAMVRAAQVKKDNLEAAAEREKRELRWRMTANNVLNSSNLAFRLQAIEDRLREQVELVKIELDYKLGKSPEGGNEYGEYSYPDNPDYSLSMADRFWAVHDYYMALTNDADERVKLFAADEFAKVYLENFYQTLYERFVLYRKQQS